MPHNCLSSRLPSINSTEEGPNLLCDIKKMETSLRQNTKKFETSLKRAMKELEISLQHDLKELEKSLRREIKDEITARIGRPDQARLRLNILENF